MYVTCVYSQKRQTHRNISQGHCIFITRLYSSRRPAICLSCGIYCTYSHHHMVRLGIKDLRHRIGHRYGEKKGKNDRKEGTHLGVQTG